MAHPVGDEALHEDVLAAHPLSPLAGELGILSIQPPQAQGGSEDEDGGASYLDGHVSPDPSIPDDCATLATQLNGHRRPAGSIKTWRRIPACDE